MIKTVVLSGGVLLAAALFAVDTAAAGPCAHIHDPPSCSAYSECFWDAEDDRCEQRDEAPTGRCGSIANPYYCGQTPGCFWDRDDDRCEAR